MGYWLLMTYQAENWDHVCFEDRLNVSWALTFLWNLKPKRFFWERAEPLWAITRLLMLITTPAAHKTGFSRDKTARTFEHKRIKFEQTYNICFHHVHQAKIKQNLWITLELINLWMNEGAILLRKWLFSNWKQVHATEMKCVLVSKNHNTSLKFRSIFHILWGADSPHPHGQPDHEKTVFT